MTSKNFDHPFKRSQIDRPEQADPTMIANELDELTEGSIIFNVVTVSSRLVHPADVPEAPNWRTVARRQTIDLSSSTPRTIEDAEFNKLSDGELRAPLPRKDMKIRTVFYARSSTSDHVSPESTSTTGSNTSSSAKLTSTPTAGEYDAAYIRKASDCLKFHRKLGHASTEKAEMMIPLCKCHNFVPGDMRRYMPVCPTCWLNSFDHK